MNRIVHRPRVAALAAALGLFSGTAVAAVDESGLRHISLEQAVALSHDHSVRLDIANARTEAAQGARDARRAAYLPKVDLLMKSADAVNGRGANYQRTLDEYGQSQLSMQYTLFDFGRRKADLGKASHDLEASLWAERQEIQDLQYQTVRAYVDVDRYRRILAAADAHVAELEHFAGMMADRVQAGISPQSEQIRTRLATTGAQNQRKRVQQKYTQSLQLLQSLTGQAVTADEVADTVPTNHVAGIDRHLVAAALQDNPSVRARRLQVRSSEQDVARSRAERMPRVDMVAGYKEPFESDISPSMGGNVGVQLSMNLFDGGARSARLRQANAALREAEAQSELIEREITDTAQNLLVDAGTSWDQIRLSLLGRDEARRTRELYTDEFTLGTRSVADLITAQTDAFTQEVELRDAIANHILSAVGLYHLQGDVEAGLKVYGLTRATTTQEAH